MITKAFHTRGKRTSCVNKELNRVHTAPSPGADWLHSVTSPDLLLHSFCCLQLYPATSWHSQINMNSPGLCVQYVAAALISSFFQSLICITPYCTSAGLHHFLEQAETQAFCSLTVDFLCAVSLRLNKLAFFYSAQPTLSLQILKISNISNNESDGLWNFISATQKKRKALGFAVKDR